MVEKTLENLDQEKFKDELNTSYFYVGKGALPDYEVSVIIDGKVSNINEIDGIEVVNIHATDVDIGVNLEELDERFFERGFVEHLKDNLNETVIDEIIEVDNDERINVGSHIVYLDSGYRFSNHRVERIMEDERIEKPSFGSGQYYGYGTYKEGQTRLIVADAKDS